MIYKDLYKENLSKAVKYNRESMDSEGIRDSVIQAVLELTTEQEPKWQYVASKLYVYRLKDEVRKNRGINLLLVFIVNFMSLLMR